MPTPAATRPLLLVFAAAAVAAALGACAAEPATPRTPLPPVAGSPSGNGEPGSPTWAADPDALLPERMRIHPLTRVTRDPDGAPQLALHLELKDRYGHNIKSLGWLRVELAGANQEGVDEPAPGADDDGRAQSVYWEVDLRDPEQNALMYDDLISRTYLVHLGGLPGWVTAWAEGDAGASRDPWLNLHATFIAPDPANGERTLRADHRLER